MASSTSLTTESSSLHFLQIWETHTLYFKNKSGLLKTVLFSRRLMRSHMCEEISLGLETRWKRLSTSLYMAGKDPETFKGSDWHIFVLAEKKPVLCYNSQLIYLELRLLPPLRVFLSKNNLTFWFVLIPRDLVSTKNKMWKKKTVENEWFDYVCASATFHMKS